MGAEVEAVGFSVTPSPSAGGGGLWKEEGFWGEPWEVEFAVGESGVDMMVRADLLANGWLVGAVEGWLAVRWSAFCCSKTREERLGKEVKKWGERGLFIGEGRM